MARQIQPNLRYFPVDVSLFADKKIKSLKAHYGADGIVFYLYILCEVYGGTGYYAVSDDDFIDNAAADLNMSPEKIGLILKFLLDRSLLDGTLFQSDNVLSSHGIQRRYQDAKRALGQKVPIPVDGRFWILREEETESFIKVQPCENKFRIYSDNSGIYGDKSGIYLQKEIKVNKIKGNERGEEQPSSDHGNFQEWMQGLALSLPPAAKQEVARCLSQGAKRELVEWAVSEAAVRGKPWPYARAILMSKLAQGITSPPDSPKGGKKPRPKSSYDIEEFDRRGYTVPVLEATKDDTGD